MEDEGCGGGGAEGALDVGVDEAVVEEGGVVGHAA